MRCPDTERPAPRLRARAAYAVRLIALWALVALTAACLAAPPPRSPTSSRTAITPAASPPVHTATPSPTVIVEADAGRIAGLVFADSDVSTLPDTPLVDQLIVAIPRAALKDLPQVPQGLSPQEARFLAATIDTPPDGAATTTTDEAGRFSLTIKPGDYLLCLADPSDETAGVFPLRTRGCGFVAADPGQTRRVNISSGFGEILLSVEDW